MVRGDLGSQLAPVGLSTVAPHSPELSVVDAPITIVIVREEYLFHKRRFNSGGHLRKYCLDVCQRQESGAVSIEGFEGLPHLFIIGLVALLL